jgi:hypothetical protein
VMGISIAGLVISQGCIHSDSDKKNPVLSSPTNELF